MSVTARSKTVYRYEPVLFDMFTERKMPIPEGARLRKVEMHGCPRNGTMGMCYVEDADTGTFYGLVMVKSLVRTTTKGTP